MWAQYDFGDGPEVAGAATVLLPVAGLVEVPGRAPAAGQDPGLGLAGRRRRRTAAGQQCPAYLLTDNEKTVTVEHVAGMPVRNPGAVEFGRHDGLTVATCVPYDPASKGGSSPRSSWPRPTWCPRPRTCSPATAASPRWRRPARSSASRSTPARTGSPAGPGGDAGRRAAPASPGPGVPVHRGAGRDPPGGRDVAGRVRGRAVLGPAPAGRAGRRVPPARQPGRHRLRHRGPGRPRSPPPPHLAGQPAAGRRALPARPSPGR